MIQFNLFEVISLIKFNLVKELNSHTLLELVAIISEQDRDYYLSLIDNHLEVSYENNILFGGYIDEISVSTLPHNTILYLKAFSYSKKIDTIRRSRVFQKSQYTLEDILSILKTDYINFITLDSELKSKTFKYPSIQYKETDFQFIKRLLFSNGKVLVIDDISTAPQKIFLGKREYLEHNIEDNREFTITKTLNQESIEIAIKYPKSNYSIGDYLKLNSSRYWVISSISKLENEILTTYIKAIKKDIKTEMEASIYPITLKAKISDNDDKDKMGRVKVEFLDIEDPFSNDGYWFQIANSLISKDRGVFFIPSIGESVLVTLYEESSSIITSIILEGGVEFYKNRDDLYLVHSKNRLIDMSDDKIELKRSDSIIWLKEKLITIKMKDSSIDMKENSIEIKAKEIKLN